MLEVYQTKLASIANHASHTTDSDPPNFFIFLFWFLMCAFEDALTTFIDFIANPVNIVRHDFVHAIRELKIKKK